MSDRQKPLIFDNARLIDPSCGHDELGSLLVGADGAFSAGGAKARNQGAPENAERFNLRGLAIIPGLIDARCFLGAGESLAEETVATAGAAAAKGGVTALIAVGEKHGAIYDSPAAVRALRQSAAQSSAAAIYPAAALTKAMQGRELSEFGLCHAAGAIALADGQETHRSAKMLRRAFLYARDCGMIIMAETQDADLSAGAAATESFKAELMGLPAAPAAAEALALARDLALVRLTGARYHAAHISTAAAAELIKAAKAEGLPVTAATSINSLSFNEQDIDGYNAAYRFFPPLRAEEDRQALIAALRDGVIDAITSCHCPRSDDAKNRPFAEAAAGAVGLESLAAAALRLYHNGEVPLMTLLAALSANPARIFGAENSAGSGLSGGSLRPGAAADFTIIDLDRPWQFSKDNLVSACGNTAFDKARFEGQILATYRGGRRIYKNSAAAF